MKIKSKIKKKLSKKKFKSSLLKEYPDQLSIMFNNKKAISWQKRKDHFNKKYGK